MSNMEREICECFNSDLYATTLDNLSLKGSVSNGYSGDHELVLGGYKQVSHAYVTHAPPHLAGVLHPPSFGTGLSAAASSWLPPMPAMPTHSPRAGAIRAVHSYAAAVHFTSHHRQLSLYCDASVQMVEAVMAGKTHPTHSELRDVRLQHVVKAVRLVGGGGVEVEVEGQVGAGWGKGWPAQGHGPHCQGWRHSWRYNVS